MSRLKPISVVIASMKNLQTGELAARNLGFGFCYKLSCFVEIIGFSLSEGYLTSCTFDYLTNTFDTKLFVACIFTCSYVFPMSMIIYFYSGIVKQVFAHEAALRYPESLYHSAIILIGKKNWMGIYHLRRITSTDKNNNIVISVHIGLKLFKLEYF